MKRIEWTRIASVLALILIFVVAERPNQALSWVFDNNGTAERVSSYGTNVTAGDTAIAVGSNGAQRFEMYYTPYTLNSVASSQVIASVAAGTNSVLHNVTIASAAAGSTALLNLYDTASVNCPTGLTPIAAIDTTSSGGSRTLTFDLRLANGLCANMTTASANVTISGR